MANNLKPARYPHLAWLAFKNCNVCDGLEERLFTDSWTGLEICLSCLYPVVGEIAMSPASEGDNLRDLLDFGVDDDDDD